MNPHVQHEHSQTGAAGATVKDSDFSFTPSSTAAGPRVPTLKFSGTTGDDRQQLALAIMPDCCGVSFAVSQIALVTRLEGPSSSSATDGEDERLPSAAVVPAVGSIDRPASAEALEYMVKMEASVWTLYAVHNLDANMAAAHLQLS